MHLSSFLKKTTSLMALVACLTLGFTTASHATEGGGGAYANGVEGFGAGMLPPPGTYFLNYLNVYSANSLKDGNGDDLVPDFKLDAVANVFRLVHMTKYQLLGGTWGMQMLLPVVHLEVSVPGQSQSKFGLGDIVIDPFLLSFHSKNFHYAVGLDIIVPTGAYDKHDLANIGRNYWTFEPVFAATYLNEAGCEASIKLMYDFNTENSATDYQTGQEFHFDYTLAKRFGAFTPGVGGYFYKQVTDDELNGHTVGADGFKGQVLAIGPQLKYDYKNMSFSLKYQREMLVENKPEGDKFWFNLLYAF
jgi:hypothetical protein